LTAWRRSRTNDAVPPVQDALSREILETIEGALRELSWNHEQVFRKVRMQGYKYAEAAESLGMKVDTLRAIFANANGHVRQRLTAAGLAPNDGGRTKEDTP
jgi:DNA-directed RNA polymerase specialized sigma24 family protein